DQQWGGDGVLENALGGDFSECIEVGCIEWGELIYGRVDHGVDGVGAQVDHLFQWALAQAGSQVEADAEVLRERVQSLAAVGGDGGADNERGIGTEQGIQRY